MKQIVFIADYFVEQIIGGGELNNKELAAIFKNKDYDTDAGNKNRKHKNMKQNTRQETQTLETRIIKDDT